MCVCLIRIHVIKSGENPDELKKKKKKETDIETSKQNKVNNHLQIK